MAIRKTDKKRGVWMMDIKHTNIKNQISTKQPYSAPEELTGIFCIRTPRSATLHGGFQGHATRLNPSGVEHGDTKNG